MAFLLVVTGTFNQNAKTPPVVGMAKDFYYTRLKVAISKKPVVSFLYRFLNGGLGQVELFDGILR